MRPTSGKLHVTWMHGCMRLQVLVPVVFFGLMCIPKHYIKPQPRPREIMSRPYDLDMGLTSKPGSAEYFGECNCLTATSLLPGTGSQTPLSTRFHSKTGFGTSCSPAHGVPAGVAHARAKQGVAAFAQ